MKIGLTEARIQVSSKQNTEARIQVKIYYTIKQHILKIGFKITEYF
jgi:hypothetical protein